MRRTGTPRRRHRPRARRYVFSKAHRGMIPRVRLFKGWRP
jgi:hypothetical protein